MLQVESLNVELYGDYGKRTSAVRGVSFSLNRGETFCLVGESSCGKTLTSLSILNLLPPAARVSSGKIIYSGIDLCSISKDDLRKIRGNRISMVFQDAMTALNPVLKIKDQMTEGYIAHTNSTRKEANKRALSLLEQVGINSPEHWLNRYPHELSGGMRQRVMIATALMCSPDILIADEPTTALDITVQQQIIELLKESVVLKSKSLLLVSHDLNVVQQIADKVAVMYAGQIVELGLAKDVLSEPKHPYTQGLLSSNPMLTPFGERLKPIPGVVPSIWSIPKGCSFRSRCRLAFSKCEEESPSLKNLNSSSYCSCWLYD